MAATSGRVSEVYGLGGGQYSFDFVDVRVDSDTRVYIDPTSIRQLPGEWSLHCQALLHDFFSEVLSAVSAKDSRRGTNLLGSLREPNEIHLGLSRGRSQGRGLGRYLASEIWGALEESDATKSGLLRDLEDAALMIDGVGPDIISDITANIIRQPLIEFTQQQCVLHGIEMFEVDSGPMWDPDTKAWGNKLVELPVAGGGRLILVPKVIVRHGITYDPGDYYRSFLLEHLQHVHLAAGDALVHLLKDGSPVVYKNALEAHYGKGKKAIVEISKQYPEVLEQYRSSKATDAEEPLDHFDMANTTDENPPDFDALTNAATSVTPGAASATAYHRAIFNLLHPLFYPGLTDLKVEQGINLGTKRVDIVGENIATRGFFDWLAHNARISCPYIFIECKNYSKDPANEAIDQLIGRFNPARGMFGLLICRDLSDLNRMMTRCREAFRDKNGLIIPIVDDDLSILVNQRDGSPNDFRLLRDRVRQIMM